MDRENPDQNPENRQQDREIRDPDASPPAGDDIVDQEDELDDDEEDEFDEGDAAEEDEEEEL